MKRSRISNKWLYNEVESSRTRPSLEQLGDNDEMDTVDYRGDSDMSECGNDFDELPPRPTEYGGEDIPDACSNERHLILSSIRIPQSEGVGSKTDDVSHLIAMIFNNYVNYLFTQSRSDEKKGVQRPCKRARVNDDDHE